MKKTIWALACVLATSNVTHAAGWTTELTLTSVFTENSDIIVAYAASGSQYSAGCHTHAWVLKADTDARRAREYATLLAAVVAGKQVKFYYSDTCGTWGYHEAISVMILQ